MGKMPNVCLWLLHECAPTCEHICTDIEHGEREGGRERETESKGQRQRDDTHTETGKQRDRHTLRKEKTLVLFGLFTLKTGDTLVSNSLRVTVLTQRPVILKNVNLETLFKISISEPSLHVKP